MDETIESCVVRPLIIKSIGNLATFAFNLNVAPLSSPWLKVFEEGECSIYFTRLCLVCLTSCKATLLDKIHRKGTIHLEIEIDFFRST